MRIKTLPALLLAFALVLAAPFAAHAKTGLSITGGGVFPLNNYYSNIPPTIAEIESYLAQGKDATDLRSTMTNGIGYHANVHLILFDFLEIGAGAYLLPLQDLERTSANLGINEKVTLTDAPMLQIFSVDLGFRFYLPIPAVDPYLVAGIGGVLARTGDDQDSTSPGGHGFAGLGIDIPIAGPLEFTVNGRFHYMITGSKDRLVTSAALQAAGGTDPTSNPQETLSDGTSNLMFVTASGGFNLVF